MCRHCFRIKRTDATKLQDEYQKLVQGLQEQEVARDEDQWLANPILPEDILKEAIPGNIRRAEHFTAFLARFVEYLKTRMRVLHVVAETSASFLQHLKELTFIEKKPLRYVHILSQRRLLAKLTISFSSKVLRRTAVFACADTGDQPY